MTEFSYGDVCIGTDFRLRKYPEQRQVAQRLRKKLVICSKDLKEITETPDKCPVRTLVGLNYSSRFPFTTQRLENDRVDHWSFVRELRVGDIPLVDLTNKLVDLEVPTRLKITPSLFMSIHNIGIRIRCDRLNFTPEEGKKHLPEENGKIYYITSEVAKERFDKYIQTEVLPLVQRYLNVSVTFGKTEAQGSEFGCMLTVIDKDNQNENTKI